MVSAASKYLPPPWSMFHLSLPWQLWLILLR